MLRDLRTIKASKVPGPNSVFLSMLKCCTKELSKILSEIFNVSLQDCAVPAVWKMSSIISVRRKNISSVNDLRPVARTSCVMKVFERCVLCYLDKKVFDYIHPYQFAYKFKSRVEGVITYVLYNIYTHLHFPGASDRRLMSFF